MLYLVTYELVGKEEEYAELWAALESDRGHRILGSNWLVDTDLDSFELVKRYLTYLRDDDRMFICEAANPAWYRLENEEYAETMMNA